MTSPALHRWTLDALLAEWSAQGLACQSDEDLDALVQAANQLAELQYLLALQLPQNHLPVDAMLAPIADWLA